MSVDVLLIEDNLGDAVLIRDAINRLPVPVDLHLALDGHQALLILSNPHFRPDLIILDLSLPDLSGWDVAKTVRESLPAVPILLLTAHGGSPMIEEIRRRGLQGYVSKSEADTTLLAAIDAILHLKQGFFPTN